MGITLTVAFHGNFLTLKITTNMHYFVPLRRNSRPASVNAHFTTAFMYNRMPVKSWKRPSTPGHIYTF